MLSAILATCRLILPEFRLRFLAIVAVSVLVAMLEMVGVASVMPLIAVMVDPERIMHSRVVGEALRFVGLDGVVPPVHVLGLGMIVLFVCANAGALFLNWRSVRFSAGLGVALSERLARGQFRQPFALFLARTPSDLANEMCNEVSKVTLGGVLQLCFTLVRAMQVALVLALLLAISPAIALALFSVTAALYALIYRYSARHIGAAGERALQASGQSIDTAAEMYGFAREIALGAGLDHFVRRISTALGDAYRADGTIRILPVVPKYALETIALCALFALPIYRSFMGEDVRPELAVLGTFAYAGFRLLPVLQQLYSSATLLRFYQPMAEKLVAALRALKDVPAPAVTLDRMPRSLAFDAVGFAYPGRRAAAVTDASFQLTRGERLAIIGPSGAGKTTLVDLVLGLLAPGEGTIRIDGRPLGPGGFAWKRGVVGYVPQTPLILRDTIARNIALGLGDAEIDLARCREAAAKAGLRDLIDGEAQGLGAVIGAEIGNLSGGERQRLAIARALYSRPDLLVLDEPASALDVPMSRRMFELLCGRDLDATVIVVTHDIEYLPLFDRVVFMAGGRVLMSGSHDALIGGCPEFRRFQGEAMARAR